MSKRSLFATLMATCALAFACTDQRSGNITAPRSVKIAHMLVPSVASQLTAAGRFPSMTAEQSGTTSVISPQRASELALAYMREYGPHMRQRIERQRGSDVDFAALAADPQVWLSESPFAQLPADAPPPFERPGVRTIW